MKRIIDSQYERIKEILVTFKPSMHSIVETLMVRETLSGEEFRILLKGGQLPDLEDSEDSPPQAPSWKPATN